MKSFEELRELVASVTSKGSSPLYRKLYRMDPGAPALSLGSMADWRALPFLEKSDLHNMPAMQRVFVPHHDIDALYVSSGTSGNPPLFTARTKLDLFGYRAAFYDNPRALLSSIGPPHRQEYWLASQGYAPRVIGLDQKHVRPSVRLAKAAGVDGVYAFAFLLPQAGACMQELGIAESIRFVEITGEACSDTLYAYARATFPNATIIGSYGANEVEDSPHGIPCTAAANGSEARRFHPKHACHFELVDPDTGAPLDPVAGSEGELVITTGGDSSYACPLIRYRSGDMARVEDTACALHGAWTFSILGRVDADTLKMPHGQLRADEIERVLRSLAPEVADEFEAHRFERAAPDGPRVHIVLHVSAAPHTDLHALAARIAQRLRTSPSTTYADNVRLGRYAPLECRPLKTTTPTAKRRRLISH